MYKIKIKDLKVFGYHGLYQNEKKKGQNFIINLEYEPIVDIDKINDDISKTVDYVSIVDFIISEFNIKRFKLIESLAENLMKKINNSFKIKCLNISILKEVDINNNFSVQINLDNE